MMVRDRVIYHRGTEGTEDTENCWMVNCTPTKFLLFSVPSVSSVPLW